MTEKSTVPATFIARGVDQHAPISNIPAGRSESQYNFDTVTEGQIQKRVGYELDRNIPIRIVSLNDRGTSWEIVAHPSIDLLGVPSGPIVINGQAINISTGELESVSFYWTQFDNLGAFTLDGTFVGSIWEADVTISQSSGLDTPAAILRQDAGNPSNNEAILADNITNIDKNDGTFEFQLHFESDVDFDNSTYTLFKPDDSVVAGNVYYDTQTPILGQNTLSIPQSTHGLAGENFVIQVWQENVSGLERSLVIADRIYVGGSGDVEVDVDVDTTYDIHTYIIAMTDAFQTAQFIDASVSETDVKTFCLTDVTTNSNFWSLYQVDASGNQTLVIPDEVIYDQNDETLCFNFLPTEDSVYKAIYLPGLPVSAGVIIDKIDNSTPPQDTSDYDMENADLALHGIDWDGVVVSATAPEFSYVREVDNYKSVALEKLTAVASGDLWIEDLDVNYTLTASQSAEQTAALQYLSPFIGASSDAQSDGRGRGINADEVVDFRLNVNTITNNGNQTITLVSEPITNITGDVNGIVIGTDKLTIADAEYSEYIGEFVINAISVVNDPTTLEDHLQITVLIPDLEDYIGDETNSAANIGIFTDYIIMSPTNFDDINIGDKINNIGGLLGSEVYSLDAVNYRMWLTPVTAERLLPGSVDVTWDRITNVIFVDDVEDVVPQDVVNITGFNRRFKILSIDVANESVTINEPILVSNYFGDATQITLDGRLALPLKPANNIAKDFPFEPTGEYSTEIAELNDSQYITTYDRAVVKFDGTHISDAGIQEIPVYDHSWIVPKTPGTNENEFGFISPNAIAGKISALNADTDITIILTNTVPSTLFLGQTISVESSNGSVIVDGEISDIDRDTDTIIIDVAATAGYLVDDVVSVFEPTSFGYYFRIEYNDRNGQIIVGTPNSYVDCIVTITRPSVIMHKTKLPTTGNGATEWDRLKIAMYRTKGAPSTADITPVFYKVDDTPALKGLTGSKASDAQAINDTVMSDTTSDITLVTPDFISNAQIASLGGPAVERPIAAARPPQAQYLLSTDGKMVYGNIRSEGKLLTTWAKNKAGIKDIVNTEVTLTATYASVDYDLVVKFVDASSTNIDVADIATVIEDTPANGSDFDNTAEESEDVGFLKLTLSSSPVTGSHDSRYAQIISKDGATSELSNEFVGALIGWHKITKTDGADTIYIRVPQYIADEFTTSTTITNLQVVLTTDDVVPCWDVVYDETPSADVTLPNSTYDVLGRVTRNWSKLINKVMADNAYYTRIKEETGSEPTTGLAYPVNYTLGDWCFTRWGQTVGSGNVEIFEQSTLDISFRISYTSNPDGFEIFSNGFLSNSPIVSGPAVFPSRLLVSYQNYPESVDNPYADDQFKSFSAIDVNASDGQEITGLASFFSASSTGAAQLASTIIVFKTNSVYAVNTSTKETQRLQSMGQGCTIPDSIASTDDTIFFANDTGVYKVTRDLNVKYVGDVLTRYYEALDKPTLKLRGYGIADNFSMTYKMAVPVNSRTNDEVVVYNFESMSKQAEGSWVFYDNMNMSSAVQTNDKFRFGNFRGRIFKNRNTGNNTDYRDDDSAIPSSFTYAPQHFGDAGKTKIMSHTIVQFEGNGPTAITGSMALDLSENFETLDTANMGSGEWKGVQIAYSPPPTNAVFYQLKLEHSVKDEPCIINGLIFKVSIGSEAKIRQANDNSDGTKKS